MNLSKNKYKVSLTDDEAEWALSYGVISFPCPHCGEGVVIEPDVTQQRCHSCGALILIDSPYSRLVDPMDFESSMTQVRRRNW